MKLNDKELGKIVVEETENFVEYTKEQMKDDEWYKYTEEEIEIAIAHFMDIIENNDVEYIRTSGTVGNPKETITKFKVNERQSFIREIKEEIDEEYTLDDIIEEIHLNHDQELINIIHQCKLGEEIGV